MGAIEEMRAMRQKVEQAEAAAQHSKKAALIGGLDVLAQVDGMRVMLTKAREANEMVRLVFIVFKEALSLPECLRTILCKAIIQCL